MQPLLTAAILHRGGSQHNLSSLIEGIDPFVSDLIVLDSSGEDALPCASDERVRYFRFPAHLTASVIKNTCLDLVVTPYVLFLESGHSICGRADWRGLYEKLADSPVDVSYCIPVRHLRANFIEWAPSVFSAEVRFEGVVSEFAQGIKEFRRFVLPLLKECAQPLVKYAERMTDGSHTLGHALVEYAISCEVSGSKDEAYGAYLKALHIKDPYLLARKHLVVSGLLRNSLGSSLLDIALNEVLIHDELIDTSPTVNYLLGMAYLEKSGEDVDIDRRSLARGFLNRALALGDAPWLDGYMVGSGSTLPNEQIKSAHALS